ncbi:hypothetical protein GH714_001583 [Hevea brasiliensis]|uniref:Terpene synthase N-terminal domain-containing protein n=1 Tax=Hevea brasiliensis TaxID=3981 RepID=A0A6A6KH43_HEVBR|nr:hypothetical protein GH714_001537 [Hevea brasiliensis]KAF2287607.1 hypothetical protein GH714_001583 [Hevea brasiliensis]
MAAQVEHLASNMEQEISRPLAYFPATVWGCDFASLPLFNSEIESYTKKAEVLKEKVKDMLMSSKKDLIKNIEFINLLCRLGISYHFENEIEEQLNHIFNVVHDNINDDYDLYNVALLFRVLRHHGYKLSCNVFKKFKDSDGKFNKAISNDVKGILSLYEASFVKEESHNETLLKFAKLDYNRVQLLHKQELGVVSRWWKELDLAKGLPYVRDRIAEGFFQSAGVQFEPDFALSRILLTKCIQILALVDDTYDSYVVFLGVEKLAGVKEFKWLETNPKLVEASKFFGRLLNDMVARKDEEKEGHCLAGNCYMKEYGVSKEKAMEELRKMCDNAWKDMNEESMRPTAVPMPLITSIVNLARMMEVVFQYDDGYTIASSLKDHVTLMFLEPIPED